MNMNNNVERNNQIQGVGENSFMHKCYLGSMAKVTGYDVIEFLQGFIKGVKGDIGMIYSQDPETKEVQGMLAIGYNTPDVDVPLPYLPGFKVAKFDGRR